MATTTDDRPPSVDTAAVPGASSSTPSHTESPVIVSSHISLAEAVYKRRAEYTRSQNIKVKVGTWNVASISGTEKDIGAWFVDGKGVSEALSGIHLNEEDVNNGSYTEKLESVESQEKRRSKKKPTVPSNDPGALPGGNEIGLYVLGLQEIVDISSATEALRPFNDPHPAQKWKRAVGEGLPQGYRRVAEQQLIGLYLLIYAREDIADTISSVSTTSVGTGLMGYMGNKGAVTARIVLGETTRMVFVNCHLTAGNEKGNLERRNWDASQILNRTKFEPIHNGGGVMEEFGEGIGDEDFAFWFGDLNYRLEDMPPEDVRRLLMLHTRNEYHSGTASTQKIMEELSTPDSSTVDRTNEFMAHQKACFSSRTANDTSLQVSNAGADASTEFANPEADPTSLQTTLSSLLPHDQLHCQMRERKAFHDGWREGPISFLPTYKYDVGSVGMFDSSEKRRGPSWCDRILFRTRKDRLDYDRSVREDIEAKTKDEEMKTRGVVEAVSDEDVLFDYDPETDGADDERDALPQDPEVVITKSGYHDRLHLDHYTSHQRVLSSDHKPLDAVFTLDYDAIDATLKAKVHQEVARELDKAENDGRPSVTIVIDQHRQHATTHTEPASPSFEGVDFKDVKYDHPKSRTITIANTGRVPATLGFTDRSAGPGQTNGLAPSWLTIVFDRESDNNNANPGALKEYTLQPGDAVNVELILHINDLALLRRLNDHDESLEDVLVLRIHNGRDYFLPIRGKWLQSVFGRSIDKLVRMPEGGVRKLQQQRPESRNDSEGVKSSAPRELFRLTFEVESLVERAIGEFEMKGDNRSALGRGIPAWPFVSAAPDSKELRILKEAVRDALDTETPLADVYPADSTTLERLEAVSQTLLLFIRSLSDGIVPVSVWLSLETTFAAHEKLKRPLPPEDDRAWMLDTLSATPAHSVAFTFITFTLARVANEIAPLPSVAIPTSPSQAFQEAWHEQVRIEHEAGIRRKTIEGEYARVWGEAMVRFPDGLGAKARKTSELRRTKLVEVFLSS